MLLLLVLSFISIPPDSFEMREICRIPGFAWSRYTCGDADHDGRQEIYMMFLKGLDWTNYILEFLGGSEYDTFPLGYIQACVWDIGDADQDGRTDLLIQYADSLHLYLRVLESPDSISLPSRTVWQQTTGPVMRANAIISDLDSDGKRELTFFNASYHSSIDVYECTGPDRYTLAERIQVIADVKDLIQTPDLDRDGVPELLVVHGEWAYLYEAVADDLLVVKASFQLPSRRYSFPQAVGAAMDMDRDGRNEAIVFGTDIDDNGILIILESPCDDSFEIVWSTQFLGTRGHAPISVGDVDGDGIPEFALADDSGIRLFRCMGNDQYEQFWQGQGDIPSLYDIDSDRKTELIHLYRDSTRWTIIRKYVCLALAEHQMAQLERVGISPSVVARGKTIGLDRLPDGTKVQVVDVSGRVVAEPERLWNTHAVLPGAYFLRLTKGNQSITRKVLVVE